MKDKEKKIEEMAKALLEYIKVYGKLHLTVDGIDNTARLFVKFGITKLPEDSVVLTKEEAERFRGQTINIAKIKAQARNETAEKIYKLVDNKLDLYRNGVIGGSLYDSGYQTAIYDIKRTIKELFDIEIKE